MLWTRLKEESKKIHPDIDFLIHWLHDLLWNLKHDEDWDPDAWENTALSLTRKGVPIHINSTQDKEPLQLAKCAELETEYMLGEPRFDKEHLSSLRLFLMINDFLRNPPAADNLSNRVVSSQMMAEAIERWVSQLPEGNVTERKTVDWFRLFANPKHDGNNLICQSIARTFDKESPHWPREPLARLYMGGWRIKTPHKTPRHPHQRMTLANSPGWTKIRLSIISDPRFSTMPSPTNAMSMKNTTQNCVCFLA